MTTGEKIKAARKKAGLTQKELGEKLGVSAAMIAQYENDKRNPKWKTLRKIADALNMYTIDLVGDWGGISKAIPSQPYPDSLRHLIDKIVDESADQTSENALKENINKDLDKLNFNGKKRAARYINDLTKIPDYQKDPDNQGE